VIWKGVSGPALETPAEEGMEVIATGRTPRYGGQSEVPDWIEGY